MKSDVTEIDVPLAALVETLRQELTEAIGEGANKDLHFGLGDIELELQVGVSRRGGVEGGIRISVLTLGATRGVDRTSTHTLRLVLHPEGELLIGAPADEEPE
jgi:hypothetical protein